MKTAKVRVFPPKKSSLLQTIPGQPNGAVMNVAVDVDGACQFLSEIGPDLLIGLTMTGPAIQVWYWQESPLPAEDEVSLG